MRLSLSLLALTTVALLGAALWPRMGQPVLLLLPPGASAAPAFALDGWRVLRARGVGPTTILVVTPETPGQSPHGLRQATGAILVTHAAQQPGCAPVLRKTSTPWT